MTDNLLMLALYVAGMIALLLVSHGIVTLWDAMKVGNVHAWLDEAYDTYGDYMDAERERRNEVSAYGADKHNSPLGYYGLSGLVHRRLFVIRLHLAERLYRWHMQPQGDDGWRS